MRLSDARIIAVSHADPARFAGIFDRHVYAIRRFVTARLGLSRSDDVVSETFRIAFERRSAFDPNASSALPWLYGIANNLVRRDQRSNGRWLGALERAAGQGRGVGDPLLDLAERLDARSEILKLEEALLTLSEGERQVLLLIAWEQLTPTEAAAVLDIAPETARSRLHRARLHIRTHLKQHERTMEVTTDAH